MFKKSKSLTFFFILSLLTAIIGPLLADNKLKWIMDTTGYETAIGLGSVILWSIFFIMWFLPLVLGAEERHKKEVEKGNAPVFESNCTHISGLASFTAEGKIRIYVDRIHFTVAGTHYELPIERIRSADILTQKQTEYVSTSNMGRIILSGLLFGELGMLISAERAVDDRERTITEQNLVLTYEKDGEAKFIVLKNLPCEKVIREIKKLVTLTPRHVDL